MKILLTCIHDTLSGFGSPSQAVSEAHAVRSFVDAVKNNGFMSRHVADFSLWKLGEYDLDTGKIEPDLRLLIAADEIMFGGDNDAH